MTNKAIDGVPLLPCPFCGGEPYGTHDHYVHDDLSPMPCVECRACSAHLKAEDWNRRVQPAAQPQGEPVAWQYRVSAGPQTGWSLWHDGKGEEFKQFYQVETRPLYAEQPAPVADPLAKGFTTLESDSGKYKIVTSFATRDDAWSAYRALLGAKPAPVADK